MKTKTKIKPENFTFSRTKKKYEIEYKDALFYEKSQDFLFKASYPFFEGESFNSLNKLSLSLIEAYFDYAKKKKTGNIKIVFHFAAKNYLSLLIYVVTNNYNTCRSINYSIDERALVTPKEVLKIQGIKGRKLKKAQKGYKVIKDTVHFCQDGIRFFAEKKDIGEKIILKLKSPKST